MFGFWLALFQTERKDKDLARNDQASYKSTTYLSELAIWGEVHTLTSCFSDKLQDLTFS